jgi:nucleoside 2-deoxyribosyltransferase
MKPLPPGKLYANLELKELHQCILVALYLGKVDHLDDLVLARQLLLGSNYQLGQVFGKGMEALRRARVLTKFNEPRTQFFSLAKSLVGIPGGMTEVIVRGSLTNSLFGPNEELEKAVDILVDVGLITRKKEPKGASDEIALTDEGLRVATSIIEGRRIVLRPPSAERVTIFVASAFGHEEQDLLFEREIRPAIESCHYIPLRVDLVEPLQTISDRVMQGIRECRCMVADLTFARPSVYFEVGVAHGLGIPVILTCRKDHDKNTSDSMKVHFDLEQHKISYWQLSQHGFTWAKRMHPQERLKEILNDAS